ncbi:MAG: cytochrome c biogenesis protein DipZ [Candidatus Omnitrophica bacterium]|nr:cytochrome c biogenesis protein DipZ [Candidatus Omnitrophota bacterium]
MSVLFLFSFLAGFVTILAPCIWPLLPIVLSASSQAGRQRPLGITLGVMTSFSVFTLFISYLEKIFHLDANVFRLLAVIIIGLLGISMMIPALGARFETFVNQILSPFQNKLKKQGAGFGAGYMTGFSIGLVWAPCAGPILATIATLAATQAVDARVILVTLTYVCGLGIPLYFFSLAGSKVFVKMRQVTKYTGVVQQVFGFIMIVAALLIYTNYDKVIQVKILDLFPSYGNFLSRVENNDQVARQLGKLRGEGETSNRTSKSVEGLSDMGPAPELTGISFWLNSPALTMAQLRGKVVLVDFWTYSCVNCVRTLPHVTDWYERYKDKNFIVIGVHTPEFAFEKEPHNVQNALREFKINYPVALDNNYGTWQAYKNHYWPAEYLIDRKGNIRHIHFGEGHYERMELSIRQLLKESGQILDVPVSANPDITPHDALTPETYLGRARIDRFASNERIVGGAQTFTHPAFLALHTFAYEGRWDINNESAKAQKGSALLLHFKADKVFLVVGPGSRGDQIQVFIDDRPADPSQAGADLKDGRVILDEERLYHLLDFKGKIEPHLLRLEFKNDGILVYAFTFG